MMGPDRSAAADRVLAKQEVKPLSSGRLRRSSADDLPNGNASGHDADIDSRKHVMDQAGLGF